MSGKSLKISVLYLENFRAFENVGQLKLAILQTHIKLSKVFFNFEILDYLIFGEVILARSFVEKSQSSEIFVFEKMWGNLFFDSEKTGNVREFACGQSATTLCISPSSTPELDV